MKLTNCKNNKPQEVISTRENLYFSDLSGLESSLASVTLDQKRKETSHVSIIRKEPPPRNSNHQKYISKGLSNTSRKRKSQKIYQPF